MRKERSAARGFCSRVYCAALAACVVRDVDRFSCRSAAIHLLHYITQVTAGAASPSEREGKKKKIKSNK